MVVANRRLLKLVRRQAARDEMLVMQRRGQLVPPPVKPVRG